MKPRFSNKRLGFSLVEITIAIGIFVFCILGIVGLLGIALDSSRDSLRETATMSILRTVDAHLRTDTAYVGKAPAKGTTIHFYFDTQGTYLDRDDPTPFSGAAAAAFEVIATRVDPELVEFDDPESVEAIELNNCIVAAPGRVAADPHSVALCLWSIKINMPSKSSNTQNLFLGHSLLGP